MSWFEKITAPKFQKQSEKDIQKNLWIRCTSCEEVVYQLDIDRNFNVCPKCNYHFKISSRQWISYLANENSFVELDSGMTSLDPLNFKDSKKYKDRIKETMKKTGENEAFIYGLAHIGSHKVTLGCFEFNFLGGSMASVVGEKITRSYELALTEKIPAITISLSGGARMQEGIYSLMQMAKTCAALAKLKKEGLPYISILADPTSGGVAASFAMLGDINIAEPKALICFAGPRVIEQTIKQKLPDGFQRSEFLLEHGMIDLIIDRPKLKETIIKLLSMMSF